MSLITKTYTFTTGSTIFAAEHNDNFDTLYNDYNGNITNANISGTAGIVDSKLAQIATAGKVSGAALTSLTSVPSGAGRIPMANVPIDPLVDTLSFNQQGSAPSTAASDMAVYPKNDATTGQPELFAREESDGDEVQLTFDGNLAVRVATGTVAHGGTIPLPTNYVQAECSWMVGVGSGTVSGSHPDGVYYDCTANASRVVTARAEAIGSGTGANITANYIIVGVK